MPVLYGKFEMPEKITNEKSTPPTFARFVAEPFERGFGHTIGNSLRRMLLTSLEAPSIVSIFIEGVPHEYMSIDGIIEDMTNIILNFKSSLLRKLPMDDQGYDSRTPRVVSKFLNVTAEDIEKNGEVSITLGDLIEDGEFNVVNPELHLFTVTKPMTKRIDLKVAIGRGYVPSERHVIENRVTDEIVVDSAFSPVRLVNYEVENTRVGQDTDYDRLILEITTDGRITPEEAMVFAAQIGIRHLEVFAKMQPQQLIFEQNEAKSDDDRDEIMQKLALRIGEIELSVRSTNCLNGAEIEFIGELVVRPESEMLKFRNFGKKSLNEIKAKLHEMNMSLGMDLAKFNITRENVREVILTYLQNHLGKEA
ncbi:MAG: DNA-directed RNA polymerase subunit alpha [Parachlamydiales bacterium]|nr:DNA-directed RNA polymerase subunit alpha [Parachlamydiales bacterium]